MIPVPGGRRAQHDLARAKMAVNIVMQRAAFAQGNTDHLAFGGFRRLAHGIGHFARLAGAKADAALLVADHHECGKTEALTALHHLGDAVNRHQLFDERVFLAITAGAGLFFFVLFRTCHVFFPVVILRILIRLRGRRRPAP